MNIVNRYRLGNIKPEDVVIGRKFMIINSDVEYPWPNGTIVEIVEIDTGPDQCQGACKECPVGARISFRMSRINEVIMEELNINGNVKQDTYWHYCCRYNLIKI